MDAHKEGAPRRNLWVVAYAGLIFRFRWVVIVLSLVVVGIGCYGVRYLQLDPDTKLFFDPASPQLQELQKFEDTYKKGDDVAFIIAPKDGNVFSREALTAVLELSDEGSRMPFASQVVSLSNYPYTLADGDDISVSSLVPPAADLTDEAIATVRERANAEKASIGLLLSPKADLTIIDVVFVIPDGERHAIPTIAKQSRDLSTEIARKYPSLDVRLSGTIVADQALAEASDNDIWTLLPVMCVLVIITLWVGFRSAYSMVATLTVVLMSMGISIGAGGWLGMVLNNVTAGAPILTMTLAIADCVHLLAGAGQLRRKGLPTHDAVTESLRINWWPVLMTSVTTAVSFLCMNFADAPPLRQMGTLVAIGVTAAWILSITFFIAILYVLPAPKRLPILSDPRFMTGLSRGIIRYNRPILAGAAVLVAVLAYGITQLRLNDDFFKYFSTDYAFRQDTDFLEKHGIGLHTILYSVESGKEGGVMDPDYLKKLDEFASWMRGVSGVTNVSVFSDTIRRIDRSMHGDVDPQGSLPDSRDMIAQYILFYEMALPPGVDLSSELDIARSSSRVSVSLTGVNSNEIAVIAESGRQWLAHAGLGGYATGISVLYSYIAEANIRSMVVGTGLELVVISLLMVFILRSFKIGLISLVPNLVPAIMAFGFWGWYGEEVNLAISVVAAMTFGVIVDDTIHSLTKYMHARRDLGLAPREAVEYTFVAAGDPMILAGLTLILGFGVLSFSGFAVTHQMGVLSSLVLGLAIIADLVLLPPLLLVFDRAPGRKMSPIATPATDEGTAT